MRVSALIGRCVLAAKFYVRLRYSWHLAWAKAAR